jgi:demethoxyubiquinone hydroxylase (CLK1/Coq7/Cat5 family)
VDKYAMNAKRPTILSILLILSSFVAGAMTNKEVLGEEIFRKIVKCVVTGT